MRRLIIAFIIGLTTLFGCHQRATSPVLSVGVMAGPEAELIKTAAQVAQEKYGLTVKLVEFNDYVLPNEALNQGSLDVNIYQHQEYLQSAMRTRGYRFKVIGKTFVFPMAVYSKRFNNIQSLPEQASIGMPNDPSNQLRALRLLASAHIIALKKEQDTLSLNLALDNPKHFHFVAMDAAQLPRALADVDIAVINTTYALPAGLNPSRDGLLVENKDSPYANLIVVREDIQKTTDLQHLIESIHSEAVKAKAYELFGTSAIPAW